MRMCFILWNDDLGEPLEIPQNQEQALSLVLNPSTQRDLLPYVSSTQLSTGVGPRGKAIDIWSPVHPATAQPGPLGAPLK